MAQTDIVRQVKQMTQTKPVSRIQREFARMRGAFSDFFYLFFL
ncbi:hypothetical protein [Vampirovibrio sp.]